MRSNLFLKLLVLGALSFVFGVALILIAVIVSERERTRDRVVSEVAASTAGAQVVAGPVLVVSYRERVTVPGGSGQSVEHVVDRQTFLLPESLHVSSVVDVEPRSRGIYRAQVFRSTHRLRGTFRLPPRLGMPERIVGEPEARLAVGVGDTRGLRQTPTLRWEGAAVAPEPGTTVSWLENGFSAPLHDVLASSGRQQPFEVDLELVGTDRLALAPLGAVTVAEMRSNWRHPSFNGGFLPDHREVGTQGFSATWRLSRFATGIEVPIEPKRMAGGAFAGRDCGVRFVQPVDVYQQSQRAVKYGLLFVLLTFATFFLFEVLRRLSVHPIQYGLAGAAVALFFLLLISLSEHLPFAVAYALAAASCVGLLAFYVSHVLGGVRRALGFAGVLAGLYGVLYLLLQSEDYALLFGSVLLFGLLAVVMVITRRVDWYRLGEPA